MDATNCLHQYHWPGLPFRRLLCSFQAGGPSAFRLTLRHSVSRCFCFLFLHASRHLSRSGFGHRVSEERRVHSVSSALFSLLSCLPAAPATLSRETVARRLALCAGAAFDVACKFCVPAWRVDAHRAAAPSYSQPV